MLSAFSFARGIAGMKEGEIRKVFVHPDLAYGTNGKLDPNLLIIFTVELVSANSPPPLKLRLTTRPKQARALSV